MELQHEQEMQQQIEREIDEMERHKQVETQMERKRDKKGKMKQLPKQHEPPQSRQTRVLRKRERQGNVDLERHKGEGVEIRLEAAGTERKQREGEAKQLSKQPEQPEQPEPPQAGHSRVLRKRERH